MKDDLRLGFYAASTDRIRVAQIALDVIDVLGEMESFEVAVGFGRQCETRDVSAELQKPGGQPGALETGMTCDEDSLPSIGVQRRWHLCSAHLWSLAGDPRVTFPAAR